jgi:hypothetical protein
MDEIGWYEWTEGTGWMDGMCGAGYDGYGGMDEMECKIMGLMDVIRLMNGMRWEG